MRFLLICWCLNNFIVLYDNMCVATIFDKRKTKRKTGYADGVNALMDFRTHVPLKTQRNIITKILYELKKGNMHKLPYGNDERDTSNLTPGPQKESWQQRVQKSVIHELVKTVNPGVRHKATSGRIAKHTQHALRRDYISNLPKPKIELIDGILNNAVTQIFNKVIPMSAAKKNETMHSYEALSSRKSENVAPKFVIPLSNTTAVRRNNFTNEDTKKHRDFDKKDVLGSHEKQSDVVRSASNETSAKRGGVVNDTLLKQIDAVTLETKSNDVKIPKDVVTSFVKAIDASEISALSRDSENTALVKDAERSSLESDDEAAKNVEDGKNKNLDYYFENSKETLTNEDEEDTNNANIDNNGNDVSIEKEVQRPAEKHALNFFPEENNAYRKHRVSPSESFEDENLGQDYGTLFIKDNRDSKQFNFYNADVHFAVTVNSSESRLNAMKAVATFMKELGGLSFEQEDEGVVSKTQFDKLMVDADEEDEPTVRSGDKTKRPNIPLNERQVRITKFKDYSAPYITRSLEGFDAHNPYTPKHVHPRKLKVGEDEEEEDKDEDAINYYQKNKVRDEGEGAIDGEERDRLIPIGPVAEIDTKRKVAAVREDGDILDIKGIRRVDKTTAVQGDTRGYSDIKTDNTPIPAIIHVGLNELNNPKSFEKIFTDRVLLAPVIDKNGDDASKKGLTEYNVPKNISVANPKKRHSIKFGSRVISHKGRGNTIYTGNDDVDVLDDKDKLFFDKLNVNSYGRDDGPVKVSNRNNDADVASETTRHDADSVSERTRRMCFYKFARLMPKKESFNAGIINHLHKLQEDMCMGTGFHDTSVGIKSLIQTLANSTSSADSNIVSMKGSIANTGHTDATDISNETYSQIDKTDADPKAIEQTQGEKGQLSNEVDADLNNVKASLDDVKYENGTTNTTVELNNLVDNTKPEENHSAEYYSGNGEPTDDVNKETDKIANENDTHEKSYLRLFSDEGKKGTREIVEPAIHALPKPPNLEEIKTIVGKLSPENDDKPYDPCGGETSCVV